MENLKRLVKQAIAYARRHPLAVIILVALLFFLHQCKVVHTIILYLDSATYQDAADVWMRGEIDAFRTPCYPMLLGLCRQLMPYRDGLLLVVIVQIIVFYLSVASLYWTLKRLYVARNIVMIVTFAYAVNPMCGHFNLAIMTESLATSFCVFLVGCFVRWIRRGRLVDILGLFLCEAFLMFLRPAFVYVLVALSIIILALIVRKEYRKVAQLTFVVVVLGGALLGYCKVIESKTGMFTPSTVSVINTCFNADQIGKFSPEKVANPLILERLGDPDKKIKWDWDSIFRGSSMYGIPMKELYDELKLMQQKDRLMYVKFFYVNVQSSAYADSGCYGIDFRTIYIFFAVSGVLLYRVYKRRQAMLIVAVIWLLCVGNVMVDMVGALENWPRLFQPSVPLLMILIALVCNRFKIKYINS
jgi:hypothetical protein